MKNIFENSKFGDKFMTRDRQCATLRYLHIGNGVVDQAMLITPLHDILVDGDGKELCIPNIKTPHDIIDKWDEHINEEELDIIAEKFADETIRKADLYLYLYSALKLAFKAGYRKAKSE